MDRAELGVLVEELGEPAYRAQQLLEAIYRQRVESVEEISTLPQQLRVKLAGKGCHDRQRHGSRNDSCRRTARCDI